MILAHLDALYRFYGEESGVRIARKHLGRYCEQLPDRPGARRDLLGAPDSVAQFAHAVKYFNEWAEVAGTVAVA